MATIINSQVVVGTEPVLIATGIVGASHVYLHSPTGGNSVFIGNSAVTISNGFALPKNEMHEVWLPETDKLYAVVASSTETLYVLHTGGR
jgi:hypothetical protein